MIFIVIIIILFVAILLELFLLFYNHIKSFFSLKKIDNHPLFQMKLYSNYNFDKYLEKGTGDGDEFYSYLKLNKNEVARELGYDDDGFACSCYSTVMKNKDYVFARNFDWAYHPALLVTTHPTGGYRSVSMVDIFHLGYNIKLSRFHPKNMKCLFKAPYLPLDGMNECGLAIGLLRVPYKGQYINSEKITLNTFTVIRLVLDYAANVDEAIQLLKKYNILFLQDIAVHYMISDSLGKSVVLEFLDGKMEVIPKNSLWQVATNFIISGTCNEGVGIDRYYTANKMLRQKKGSIDENNAMEILSEIADHTAWSVVYNLSRGDIKLCMGEKFYNVKELGFALSKRRNVLESK